MPAALDLIAAVGAAAEQADHHPDVDWRHRHVFVRTTTHAAGNQVTARDTALATRISALAAERGVAAVPVAACSYEIGVDTVDLAALAQTWAAALGYRMGPQENEVSDPPGRGPTVDFNAPTRRPLPRLHLDVRVAAEKADQTVDRCRHIGWPHARCVQRPLLRRRHRPRGQPVLHLQIAH